MKKSKSNRVKSRRQSRRAFLGSLIAGIGASRVLPTLYASSSSELQTPSAPTNVRLIDSGTPTASTSILTAKDLVYKGCFATPQDTDTLWFGTSFGAITLRRVGGDVHLFSTGHDVPSTIGPPDQLFEVVVPTTLSPDFGTALATNNRASLYRWWGDVYQGKRLYINQAAGNNTYLAGLQWDEANQGIWMAYADTYGINTNDPSLILTKLNSDGSVQAYGPWRTTAGSHMTGGYMTMLPTAFTSRADLAGTFVARKRLLLSCNFSSGGSRSPWGINGHVVTTEPTPSTPPDSINDTSQVHAITQMLVQFDINHLQPAPAGLSRLVCDSLLYHPGQAADPSAPYQNAMPVLGPVGQQSGTGGNVYGDYINSTAWVNSPSGKQGVIFATCFVTSAAGSTEPAHAWYGSDTCVHGKTDPWHQATGPGANVRRLGLLIYDQNDFAALAKGAMSPYAIRETAWVPIGQVIPGLDLNTPGSQSAAIGSLRLAYDSVASRLYISEAQRDWSNPYAGKSIIHVVDVVG